LLSRGHCWKESEANRRLKEKMVESFDDDTKKH
jgi:hypothetical protein